MTGRATKGSPILLCVALLAAGSAHSQRQLPPPGGPPKAFTLPARKTLTLDNGLRATLVQYGSVPKLSVVVAVRTGGVDERREEVWLSSLVAQMMKEGTTTRSAATIAREAANMGGAVTVDAGLEHVTAGGSVLSEFGGEYIELLADVVCHPSFPQAELERVKGGMVRELSISLSQPQSLARERFLRAMYPDHPCGRLFPQAETLQAYTLEQVRAFYGRNLGARRTHVYVVGRFEPAEAERAIRRSFSGWSEGLHPTLTVPTASSERSILIVDSPGALQSTIYMGVPVIDPSHSDYTALAVTDALLGGSFASRITLNIREEKGYTYSPTSYLWSSYRSMCWVETADVATEVTGASIREVFREIHRLQSEPPTAEELRSIQDYYAGLFVIANSEPSAIIGQLQFLDTHGLPDTFLTEFTRGVYDVTPETVRRVAREQIRDEKMLIVIVGDRSKLRGQLAPFGRISE